MLKRTLWLTAGLLLAACAAPTSAPAAGSDAAWDKIQKSGKMVMGTSADYAPIEYYTPEVKLDSFDMALMKAIGPAA